MGIEIETSTGTKTWKGDQADIAKIEAWKQSYAPEYTPQIISPRDSGGNYTSNPDQTTNFQIISEEQQAREIVASLQGESNIPTSIVQTLGKTLGVVTDKITHHDAPTSITDTNRLTGDKGIISRRFVSIPRRLGDNPAIETQHTFVDVNKYITMIILIIMGIIAFLHIRSS